MVYTRRSQEAIAHEACFVGALFRRWPTIGILLCALLGCGKGPVVHVSIESKLNTEEWLLRREGDGAIWGKVTQGMGTNTGDSISKATVNAYACGAGAQSVMGTSCDEEGNFFVSLSPGKYDVLAFAEKWSAGTLTEITVKEDLVTPLGEIPLLACGSIRGRVYGLDGKPTIAHFEIGGLDYSDGDSDEQGRFRIDELEAPRTYTLGFYRETDQLGARVKVSVRPGTTIDLGRIGLKPISDL